MGPATILPGSFHQDGKSHGSVCEPELSSCYDGIPRSTADTGLATSDPRTSDIAAPSTVRFMAELGLRARPSRRASLAQLGLGRLGGNASYGYSPQGWGWEVGVRFMGYSSGYLAYSNPTTLAAEPRSTTMPSQFLSRTT